MEIYIAIVVFCFLMSAGLSAAETALTSLGRLEIQTLRGMGGKTSKLLHYWVTHPNRIIVAVLVANNMANMGASALLTVATTQGQFSEKAVAIFVGTFTFITILFAEIMPKLFARQFAMQLSPSAVRFIRAVALVLWPIIAVIEWFTVHLSRWFGLRSSNQFHMPFSEDELSQTIELAAKEGGIDKETGLVLSRLMEFPDRISKDIMTPRHRTCAISVNASLDAVLKIITEEAHSRYPVVTGTQDEIVGVLLVKDLIRYIRAGAQGSWTKVLRKPFVISDRTQLGSLLRDMKKRRMHLAVVRDERGIFSGIITLEDLIEEIVGEIQDEHDDAIPDYLVTGIGGAPSKVSGEIPIVDFNALFKTEIPLSDSYSTINGYLLKKTGGMLPQAGTLIFDEDVSFRVMSISETGIVTIEVIEHSKH